MRAGKIALVTDQPDRIVHENGCRLCRSTGQTSVAVTDGEMRLVTCRECGVAFLDPPPKRETIAAHFKDHYITDDWRLEQVYGELREEALALVADRVHRRKTGGRILDIGCAGGHFLKRHFSGAEWETFGVEPSAYAAERASNRGIRIYKGELLSVELPERFFDVVSCMGVLPYFCDPRRELNIIRRALKPDGLLVLELPLGRTQVWRHTTKLGKLTGGGSRSIFQSFHLFFYNRKSVSLLLRESGFDLLESSPAPGNRQASVAQEILFRSYYATSRIVSQVSAGRVFMGPGLAITATPRE